MARARSLLCILLCIFSFSFAKESSEDKTVEGTIKAVVDAESKSEDKANDAKSEKQSVKKEESVAVVEATTEVLKSEGHIKEAAPTDAEPAKADFQKKTLEKAEDAAKKTFKELADSGVDTKAAAVAAAESEIASADGAVGEVGGSSKAGLTKKVKQDAEKAAVAAGKAVADHPHDESLATADAVKEVKKEEKTGKTDIKKEKSKGLTATAIGAVSNIPAIAEDGVKRGEAAVGKDFLLMLALPFAGVVAWGVKTYKDGNTPYLLRLKEIRGEFSGNGGGEFARKPARETEYIQFDNFGSLERGDNC